MNEKRCFLCGRNDPSDPLEKHHLLGGANRKKSEKYGKRLCWVCMKAANATGNNHAADNG